MNTSVAVAPVIQSQKLKIASWVLQAFSAAAFLAAGAAKLAGVPMMVAIFDHIGLGQWFRVLPGAVEVAGGVALLVPATAAFGGLLLAVTMIFAVLTHLFVIGGNPGPAIMLLIINAAVVWLRRASVGALLARMH
jgi:uncharacterized membrane protein YphA (DoxX/SURF4 family)